MSAYKKEKLSRKTNLLFFGQPELQKLNIFAELELQKIKQVNSNLLKRRIGIKINRVPSPGLKPPAK